MMGERFRKTDSYGTAYTRIYELIEHPYNEWLPQHPEYKAVMAVNVEWYSMGDFNSPDYKCGLMIPVE